MLSDNTDVEWNFVLNCFRSAQWCTQRDASISYTELAYYMWLRFGVPCHFQAGENTFEDLIRWTKKMFHILSADRRVSLHPGWHVGNYSKSLGRCVPHGLLQGTDLWVSCEERLSFARFLMKYGGRGYNSWSFLLDQM